MAQYWQHTYRASEILQTAATVAAIALALGTFTETRGPRLDDVYVLPTALLFAGILSVAGALYAMGDMKREMVPDAPRYFYFIDFGLWITAAVNVFILIDNLPDR